MGLFSSSTVLSIFRNVSKKVSLLFNSTQKIVLTVSLGAICCISIGFNCYFHLLSIGKKRILNKSTFLLVKVIVFLGESLVGNLTIQISKILKLILDFVTVQSKNVSGAHRRNWTERSWTFKNERMTVKI